VLPRRTGHVDLPENRSAKRGWWRLGLITAGAVFLVGVAIPMAGAEEGRSIWRPSTWVGVVAGPPVPGEGLPAAAVPAIARPMPEGFDTPPEYEGQAQCDPTPKPGTQQLADLIKATYGSSQTVWIPRACDVGGQSEHKEGRALDWMTNVRDAQGRANAEAFLTWLMGPDQFGRPYGNAMRLGVMYIGWNDRIWRGYDVNRGWTELKGCFSRTERSADTVCHRNHIHISLTWDGASGRTSFWSGTPMDVPFCPRARSSASTPVEPRGALTPIDPVRVLNTRNQRGIETRCRLQQDRWAGDSRRIFVKVLGVGSIPSSGVSGVAIRVTALDSNAPSRIRVWSPGQGSSTPVVRVPMNGSASGETIVPVATDGTIAIANQAGAADVVIDVLGYYGMDGEKVNIPKPSEVNVPPVESGPPAQPAPEPEFPTTESSVAFTALGSQPGYASQDAAGPLQPKEVRTIALAGVPAEATSVLVTVTTTDATKKGFLRIGKAGAAASTQLKVRKARSQTNVVLLPVENGAISVQNSKKPQVHVRVNVLGYSTSAQSPKAVGRMAGTLFKGKAGAGEVRVIKAAGQLGMPKRKKLKAVLLRVTTKSKADGAVTIAAHGLEAPPTATLTMPAKQRQVSWLLVPINADGNISVTTSVRGKVRGDVVGFVRQ
jgi:hypothetical protein